MSFAFDNDEFATVFTEMIRFAIQKETMGTKPNSFKYVSTSTIEEMRKKEAAHVNGRWSNPKNK